VSKRRRLCARAPLFLQGIHRVAAKCNFCKRHFALGSTLDSDVVEEVVLVFHMKVAEIASCISTIFVFVDLFITTDNQMDTPLSTASDVAMTGAIDTHALSEEAMTTPLTQYLCGVHTDTIFVHPSTDPCSPDPKDSKSSPFPQGPECCAVLIRFPGGVTHVQLCKCTHCTAQAGVQGPGNWTHSVRSGDNESIWATTY
jgi:hypothetical protein